MTYTLILMLYMGASKPVHYQEAYTDAAHCEIRAIELRRELLENAGKSFTVTCVSRGNK